MDKRCPRQLAEHPDAFCPLAVLRLKAIRNAGRELTEEEEALLPGCPWAVNHQMSNYCFFKYMVEYGEGNSASDMEIAATLAISVDTVKKTEKASLNKIRSAEEIQAIKEAAGDGPVLTDSASDDDYEIYR
jgi:hypothetical protein